VGVCISSISFVLGNQEQCKKIVFFFATMQNFIPRKKEGAPVHLCLCKGVKKYPDKGHMKTMVCVCVYFWQRHNPFF
jgi:hypothetical protein